MKKTILVLVFSLGIILFSSCKKTGSAKIENEIDSVSYSIGVSIGQNLKMNGLDTVNAELFAQGVDDFLKNKNPRIDPMMADQIINNYIMAKRERASEKTQKESEDFLAENRKKDGIKITASGLQYEIIQEGTGAKPDSNDNVTVHYTGKTVNGNIFDSSVERGEPATFNVGQVISGWTEGLQLMQEGGKAKFYIPSDLAYGQRGAGPDIPPYAALIFDVELLSVEKVD